MYTELNSEDRDPHYLSSEEIENPGLIMLWLFDFASLPQLRQMLWIWLKTTVTNGYTKSLEFREKENILLLYEKLLKLIEANHLLYLQQKEQLQELENQIRNKT